MHTEHLWWICIKQICHVVVFIIIFPTIAITVYWSECSLKFVSTQQIECLSFYIFYNPVQQVLHGIIKEIEGKCSICCTESIQW